MSARFSADGGAGVSCTVTAQDVPQEMVLPLVEVGTGLGPIQATPSAPDGVGGWATCTEVMLLLSAMSDPRRLAPAQLRRQLEQTPDGDARGHAHADGRGGIGLVGADRLRGARGQCGVNGADSAHGGSEEGGQLGAQVGLHGNTPNG